MSQTASPCERTRVEDEQEEGAVVAEADADLDPVAVVVHLQPARPALPAVVGAVGLEHPAQPAIAEPLPLHKVPKVLTR